MPKWWAVGIRSPLCAHLLTERIEQNSKTCYCNICDKNIGGEPKNFKRHEASGQHQKKLVKANLLPSPAKAQITSFFGLPKPKPATAPPVPSVIPQPLQPLPPEDSIINVDAGLSHPTPSSPENMLLSHLRLLTASWLHSAPIGNMSDVLVLLGIPLLDSYLVKMLGRISLTQPLIEP